MSRIKPVKAIFSLGLVALLLSLALAACGDTPTTAPVAPVSTGTTAAAGTVAAQPVPATINIDIAGFKFSPAEVSIPAGTTVIWTNKDSAKHNVIADDRSFESPTLEKGQSYSRKFDAPLTLGYFCSFHGSAGQGMTGKLAVTSAPVAAAAPAATTVATQATTAVALQPSTAAAQATTAAITTAAAQATQAPAQPAPATGGNIVGQVFFRDDVQLTDQLVVSLEGMPTAPAGRAFYGWMTGPTGQLNAGQLTPGANGVLNYKFTAPQNANILAGYDKFIITSETLDPTPSAPSANIAYSGQLPAPALLHIRHLLVSFPATPNKIGLEVGLRAQTQELRRQAEFMRDALASADLVSVKLRAEFMVNMIEGLKGANFGDVNKDGKVQNVGDGYGLLKNGDQLGYLDGSKEHANLAAKADGATEEIKIHAAHVAITVDNARGWITAIRDRALLVGKASDLKSVEPQVREILALANQSLNGVDVKGDGQILPVPGSGAVLTSYQHAQLMSAITLKATGLVDSATGLPVAEIPHGTPGHDHTTHTPPAPGSGTAAPPPTTVPTTAAGGNAAQGGPGKEVKLDISQFKFGSGPLTIKTGTKVTWTNQDNAPHSATADNSSWDSGTLQKGQSFSFTFNKAGLVKYHCEIHPNMTATITVVD